MQVRNLFFTRTALGVYIMLLGAIADTGTGLAHKYDESGRLKVTDWVLAGCSLLTAVSGSTIVMASKVGANGSLTYTPRGIWGPNREDLMPPHQQRSEPEPSSTEPQFDDAVPEPAEGHRKRRVEHRTFEQSDIEPRRLEYPVKGIGKPDTRYWGQEDIKETTSSLDGYRGD